MATSYSITSEWYSANVSNPNTPDSVLQQTANLVVEGIVFGVKVTELDINSQNNWDTSYIYG